MESAKEILKQYSEEYAKGKVEYNLTEPGIIEAMKEYAKQAIDEQLDIAADEVCMTGNFVLSIDKDSIKYCTRVELK